MNITRNSFLVLLLTAIFFVLGSFSAFAGDNPGCDVADASEECDESGGGPGSGSGGNGPGDVSVDIDLDLPDTDYVIITGVNEPPPSGMDASTCDPTVCSVSGGGPTPGTGDFGGGSAGSGPPVSPPSEEDEERCDALGAAAGISPGSIQAVGSLTCSSGGGGGGGGGGDLGTASLCAVDTGGGFPSASPDSQWSFQSLQQTSCQGAAPITVEVDDFNPDEIPPFDPSDLADLPDLPGPYEEPETPRSEPPFWDWYWTGWEWVPPTFGDFVTPWSPSAVLVNLTVNPEALLSGNSASLTWVSQNATSCTGNGFSTGGAIENTTGVSTGSLTESRTYSISCTGIWGIGEDMATVHVSTQLAPDLKALNLSAVRVLGTLQMVIGVTIQNIGTAGTQN